MITFDLTLTYFFLMNHHLSTLSNDALIKIFSQSSEPIAIYTSSELEIGMVNQAMLSIWGKEETVIGKTFEQAIPEMKGQPFTSLLKQVWQSGERYQATDTAATLEVDGQLITSYFDFIYQPIKDENSAVYCILHTALEVSKRVDAWKLVKEKEGNEQLINEELSRVNEEYQATYEELLETNEILQQTHNRLRFTEHRMQELIRTTPIGLTILQGSNMIIETANPYILNIWGAGEQTVIGSALLDVFPALKNQQFSNQLGQVFASAEKISLKEIIHTSGNIPESEKRYLNVDFYPLLNRQGKADAIMATVLDVTQHVESRWALKESEQLLQEYNEELSVLNEELKTTNKELAVINEEYTSTNEQLEKFNEINKHLTHQLEIKNIDLEKSNSAFQSLNLKLNDYNSGLEQRNTDLVVLNNEISDLNTKLSDSEDGFRSLIAQAPIAMMLVKGEDFLVAMANGPMLELLGRDESIIGKPLFKQIPELIGQPAALKLIETYQHGRECAESYAPVTLRRNGKLEEGYFNFNYAPYIEGGKVVGVIDMALEVTEQVLTIREREQRLAEKTILEETLRSSEQRLQGILETMAEGVGIIDTTGQLVYANPMAQQILGLSHSEIKDRTYDDPKWQNLRLDGSDLPEEEHPMSIMMRTGKPVFDHEIGVQPPERERFYISINAAPIFNIDGELTGGIGTFMDVTTRRMMSQGKDDFISIASHELKTPVTSLKASLQLLERSNGHLSGERREKLIRQSIRSLESLSKLINDLLDTSRMEKGQARLEKKIFALSDLLEHCQVNLEPATSQKLVFICEKAISIYADDQQIGQVLINFITNAVKYAPQSPEIIIEAITVNNQEIKVTVRDFGPGIPKEKLSHLFERYYRTDYCGQKFSGLGLGLYISAEIIKSHGGKIGANSEIGKGSEFWFTLPSKT